MSFFRSIIFILFFLFVLLYYESKCASFTHQCAVIYEIAMAQVQTPFFVISYIENHAAGGVNLTCEKERRARTFLPKINYCDHNNLTEFDSFKSSFLYMKNYLTVRIIIFDETFLTIIPSSPTSSQSRHCNRSRPNQNLQAKKSLLTSQVLTAITTK